ncbi:WD repeat-containing protein 26-like [Asparagus officinalis]|nr:WD repeat-containing protein 26-like [Asparagus officinalis]XP_020256208.1 WD repeat-containing protein 26-like [Asparagus officinalis]XP_020256209.1 WD repeat-containing protein 26-like [Asparagus officinalis]
METSLSSQGKEGMVGPTGSIRREEFVRIITEALYSLGYEKTAASLEQESEIPLYSSPVTIFRKHLFDGNWDDSLTTLRQSDMVDENILKSTSFLIYEHKFFELLEKDRVLDALKTLRNEITPLGTNKKRVHELSRCIISSTEGLSKKNSQLKLVEEMAKLLPPAFMIPERRLEHLVEQALHVQEKACTFFRNSMDALSLYTDCVNGQLPSRTIQAHDDVVLFLKFSNNGRYLASSSSDKSAIVWEVHEDGELTEKHRLTGHTQPVVIVAWKSDDQQLLTCGRAEAIRRWDVTSGECLSIYRKTGFGETTCCWRNSGEILSLTTDRSLTLWRTDGTMDSQTETLNMNSQLDVTRDGKITLVSCGKYVRLSQRHSKVLHFLQARNTVVSFSLSDDGKFLLINIPKEISLWSIVSNELVKSYRGPENTRFSGSRSCFGGSELEFVAGVSDDYQVYIWLRETGDLIQTLPEPGRCISWNSKNPHMLASAYDRKITIWELIPVN